MEIGGRNRGKSQLSASKALGAPGHRLAQLAQRQFNGLCQLEYDIAISMAQELPFSVVCREHQGKFIEQRRKQRSAAHAARRNNFAEGIGAVADDNLGRRNGGTVVPKENSPRHTGIVAHRANFSTAAAAIML